MTEGERPVNESERFETCGYRKNPPQGGAQTCESVLERVSFDTEHACARVLAREMKH